MIFRKNSAPLSPSLDLILRRSDCVERCSAIPLVNVCYHHRIVSTEKKVGYSLFFDLIFVRLGIYCRLERALQSLESPFRAHCIGYFSKSIYEPAKFLAKPTFVPERNTPATKHCVFVSCWAFPCRFRNRFLAGPIYARMGRRPAFLCRDTSSKVKR